MEPLRSGSPGTEETFDLTIGNKQYGELVVVLLPTADLNVASEVYVGCLHRL